MWRYFIIILRISLFSKSTADETTSTTTTLSTNDKAQSNSITYENGTTPITTTLETANADIADNNGTTPITTTLETNASADDNGITPEEKILNTTSDAIETAPIPSILVNTNSSADDHGTTIKILHTGDIRSHFDCDGPTGGVGRMITFIKKERENSENVIYLDSGDIFSGSTWFTVHRTDIAINFTKLLKPDVVCLGNHEFDEGIEELVKFIQQSGVKVVCANVNFTSEKTLDRLVEPSVVLTVGGVKVGVIGYINYDAGSVLDVSTIAFTDPVEAVRREAETLKQQGVNIVITLGHGGYTLDMELAAKVQDIDIIVGGHSQTYLEVPDKPLIHEKVEGPYPTLVLNPVGLEVPIVHAYAYAMLVGSLIAKFNTEGVLTAYFGELTLMDANHTCDSETEKLLNYYRPQMESNKKEILGASRVLLQGQCRFKECNLANLLLDSIIYYKVVNYNGSYWTDSAIAMVNGGSIQESMIPNPRTGRITLAQLYRSLPYDNPLVTIDINGSTILKALEFSIRQDGTTSRGEFLQFSGLRVVYNLRNKINHRVESVRVRCAKCNIPKYEPLQRGKTYRVTITDYMMNGGDKFRMLRAGASNVNAQSTRDVDALKKYMKFYKVVQPLNEERIIIKNNHDIVVISDGRSYRLSRFNLLFSITMRFFILCNFL